MTGAEYDTLNSQPVIYADVGNVSQNNAELGITSRLHNRYMTVQYQRDH